MKMKLGIGLAAIGVTASTLVLAAPSNAVNYFATAKCAYSTTDPGWAVAGPAPKGTAYMTYTMRTGEPGAWDAVTRTATSKDRQWRIETGSGESFINWMKFYNANDELLTEIMVNTRCSGTPLDWPR